MNIQEAIEARHSVRAYKEQPLAADVVEDITPSWFKKGVEAALLAPTAVNQQKFSFEHVGVKNNCRYSIKVFV